MSKVDIAPKRSQQLSMRFRAGGPTSARISQISHRDRYVREAARLARGDGAGEGDARSIRPIGSGLPFDRVLDADLHGGGGPPSRSPRAGWLPGPSA